RARSSSNSGGTPAIGEGACACAVVAAIESTRPKSAGVKRRSIWRLPLLQCLQVGDDVIDVLRIVHAAKRHAVALHLALGVLDVGAQIVVVPDEVGTLHGVGIAEVVKRRRFAPE